MTRPRIAAAGTALSLWLTSAPTVAQTAASTHELRWDPALDVTVTAGGLAVWITSEVLKGDIAPARCRWCSADPVDASLRDALVWHDTAWADTLSNVTGIVLMPLSAIGLDALAAAHDGALRGAPEDALLIAEAAIVAADVSQLTKLIVGRERPFVHALPPEQKSLTAHPSDNNLSFFSGHSTEAFALATASGTVGTMRGYRWAPLAWAVGGAVAATTAYLRIAADKHWLTDVVVGAVVGAGIGFAVPYLFHSAVDDPPRLQASAAVRANALPLGTALTIAW
jgi:membrane-associated phospholipid phosphatase